jgi:thioesterase domain-containing protein
MVDTSIQAELQNSIRQAQDQLTQMGPIISRLSQDKPEARQLEKMNAEAGRLLREAQERCQKLF